jgi:hypothetical protein
MKPIARGGPAAPLPVAAAKPAPAAPNAALAKPSAEQMAKKLAAAQGRSFLPAAGNAAPGGAVPSAGAAGPVDNPLYRTPTEADRAELNIAAHYSDDWGVVRRAEAQLQILDAARDGAGGVPPAAPPKSPKPR